MLKTSNGIVNKIFDQKSNISFTKERHIRNKSHLNFGQSNEQGLSKFETNINIKSSDVGFAQKGVCDTAIKATGINKISQI